MMIITLLKKRQMHLVLFCPYSAKQRSAEWFSSSPENINCHKHLSSQLRSHLLSFLAPYSSITFPFLSLSLLVFWYQHVWFIYNRSADHHHLFFTAEKWDRLWKFFILKLKQSSNGTQICTECLMRNTVMLTKITSWNVMLMFRSERKLRQSISILHHR